MSAQYIDHHIETKFVAEAKERNDMAQVLPDQYQMEKSVPGKQHRYMVAVLNHFHQQKLYMAHVLPDQYQMEKGVSSKHTDTRYQF